MPRYLDRPRLILHLLVACLAGAQPAFADPIATAAGDPAAPATASAPAASAAPAPPVAELFRAAPGSLWNERSARTLLGQDGTTRQVGDLITVNIYESTSASLAADTSTSRASGVGAGIRALFGIESSIVKANPNMGPDISIDADSSTSYTGTGTTHREASLQGQITCTIVEVLPTGNLKLRGEKKVRSNRETQVLVLEGTVRPKDIQADNTVASYLLADAHIENSGTGVIADKQGPGIGQRVIDRIWPF
ncbi:MAG: flagellar basal body L-ring protein FlgH [Pseudomonadota bacterium]